MERRFPIADLRTLVARALQEGDYAPADSGRIRAVPDTRTIRYYTTLGLIDRPTAMQGRTALYGEQHVWQLVAIKRLQSENLTLAEVQQRLVGLTPRKLKDIAALPGDFWDSADRYLEKTNQPNARDAQNGNRAANDVAAVEEAAVFWAEPAALPNRIQESETSSANAMQVALNACWKIPIGNDASLLIDNLTGRHGATSGIDLKSIQESALPLIQELRRQGLLPDDSQRQANPKISAAERSNESGPQVQPGEDNPSTEA